MNDITKIHNMVFDLNVKMDKFTANDKYKNEHDFIIRYLRQEGYVVDEDALFESIVAITKAHNSCQRELRELI